jgi:hypothetical protein
MKKLLVRAIFCSCFFTSCNENKKTYAPTIKAVKEISFTTGHISPHKFSGVYFDKSTGTEYFYFGDPITKKCIDILSYEGEIKWHIPLNVVTNDGESLEDYSIVHPDTVMVLSEQTNKLYFLDSKGECWKKITIDTIVKPKNGDQFNYYSSMFQDFYFNNNLVLCNDWRGNKNETFPLKIVSKSRFWNNHSTNAPYFLKLSNIYSKEIKWDYLSVGLLKKVTIPNGFVFDVNQYGHSEDRFFYFSIHSNKIFELDTSSFNVKKEYLIKSKYTELGFPCIEINDSTIQDIGEKSNRLYQTKGYINRLMYDKYRKQFYVIVYHETTEKEEKKRGKGASNWSFMIYDEQFNQLNEIFFDYGKYIPGFVMVCKEGVLISTNTNERKDYDKNISRFMLFKVE